ncbi:low-specificity L-threonine aldolase [Persicimonas caeni]|uniref:Low-specificity L-threonine aldolase n=1 Tax=Persicimonas caeni TaxID=2292766 RepID=A0A4Y6PYP7_PERCE|nr:low-specificity L-threonine aldolase [Persicimonas caeni]QDG53464.1 low-specificity L-threonine aldolase [Persicimonas caeni]QED34685.1 low-specificity L-threonine aldolase [Persicimonas caeni]
MIDLRSDTVTRPTPEMRRAMAEAPVGDDVFGDDPTVHELEALAADTLGKEAALFVASGTMSNLCAIMTHCGRGDEYIVGQNAHTYRYEGGGAAVLGSVQPQPIENAPDGSIPVDKIEAAIKPDALVFAKTRLVCLENTIGGKVIGPEYVDEVADVVARHGLAFHLDGARLFNAAVALGVGAGELARPFDTVSICLSKGLGAPVGSVLCGPADFIERARRWRKVLGGGWRQAGVLAAAGIIALRDHVDSLADDHEHARLLADGLTRAGFEVDGPHTNTLFVTIDARAQDEIADFMLERGVQIYVRGPVLRLVTHRDLARSDIEKVVESFEAFAGS